MTSNRSLSLSRWSTLLAMWGLGVSAAACARPVDPASGFSTSGAGETGDDGTGDGGETGSTSQGEGDGDGDGDDDGGSKFDVPSGDGDGDGGGDDACMCGNDQWSYLWVANSSEGTVSKIDTATAHEVGRFVTRPDGGGSPSRTAVSLDGRAVVVANRYGGLTKIWTQHDDCDPMANGQPGLQTSEDDQPLGWGADDCVAWHQSFEDFFPDNYNGSQRPVSWIGELDEETCLDKYVWTETYSTTSKESHAHLVDGTDGSILETVKIPTTGHRGYGGATDSKGNFWIVTSGGGNGYALIFVDRMALEAKVYDYDDAFAGYGITVDNEDRPWVAQIGAQRFDPVNETWVRVEDHKAGDPNYPFVTSGGLAQGPDGRMWAATMDYANGMVKKSGVVAIDPETMKIDASIDVPTDSTVKGISFDVEGYLWAIPYGSTAYKLDVDLEQVVDSYGGLNGPYTYSDMTGGAVYNANCNQPEG